MATNFKDKSRKNKHVTVTEGGDYVRVRLPKGKEIVGIISQRLGGSRMYVSCMDGKTRNCRVPGGKRRVFGFVKEMLFSLNLGILMMRKGMLNISINLLNQRNLKKWVYYKQVLRNSKW